MTSKIKVDNIADQDDNNIINESGDVITVGAAGDTVAVAGNIVKSNALQASDGGNLVSQSGTTITLGASGDTINLASGASQSGFGRTGTVDWQTGSIKTATFTAASGEGYFCNTAGGGFTVNLPAGSAGAIVSIQDYNNTFDSNGLLIDPNGSEKINGGQAGGFVKLETEGEGITLVYVDATVGWRSIQDNVFADTGTTDLFVSATGGTITTCGNFKVHKFTGPGTFTVTCAGNACGSNSVDYFVVAGGGAGSRTGGGGGGGGFRLSQSTYCSASPLATPTALPVSAQGYPITVGAGGAPQNSDQIVNNPGAVSTFSTITSAGGGGGHSYASSSPGIGSPGGSGGGGGTGDGSTGGPREGGSGNQPPVSPPQGQPGGQGNNTRGGGGGGGAASNGNSSPGPNSGGTGGNGTFIPTSALGPAAPGVGESGPSGRYFSGGGGGSQPSGTVAGGLGGGGDGGNNPNPGAAAPVNTGGGGGGTNNTGNGTGGGSGIVIIRYKFQ